MTAGTRGTAQLLRRCIVVAATCTLAVGLLAACGQDNGKLDALQSDRMARATFDGAEVVSEREHQATGFVKPAPAVIRRTFEVTGEPEVVLERAVEAARNWGWTEIPGTGSFTAERTIDGVNAILLVFLEDADDVLLQVSLETT